ncbi:hypothetical protein DdX_16480 [Ditylenchus destructor]|uniref:Uncharacterized protein n=1 Tax=Ditylenchus destructor TaxID=166010 RepID=A0AAD4QU05_9BILA|nr:hypothetical protein DdX_16480 [Ditylenchus destructor]
MNLLVVSGTTVYPASEYSAAGYAPSAAGTESTLYPNSDLTESDLTIVPTDQHYEENGYYSESDADSDTIYEEDEEEHYEPAPLPDFYKGADGKTYTSGGWEVAVSAVNPNMVTTADLTYGTKNAYQLSSGGAAKYLNNTWKEKQK